MNDFLEDLAEMVRPSAKEDPRFRFGGKEYILIGAKSDGGAIATVEQFETGKCSFAHLMPDGRVMQFGKQIGTVDDIEWLP